MTRILILIVLACSFATTSAFAQTNMQVATTVEQSCQADSVCGTATWPDGTTLAVYNEGSTPNGYTLNLVSTIVSQGVSVPVTFSLPIFNFQMNTIVAIPIPGHPISATFLYKPNGTIAMVWLLPAYK